MAKGDEDFGVVRRIDGKPLRIHGTVARDLGISIVSGEYLPGAILDNEVTASEELKVSRTAYREAVRILSAKGLVEARPKIGTRVSPRKNWHLLDPDVLYWMFQREPDEQLLASLFELRRIIEPEGAALAAERRSDEHLRIMERALQDMRTHTLATEAGRAADQLFHSTMLDATGNAFLASLTSGVEAAVSWTTEFKQRKAPLQRDALPDHIKVFEAVSAADAVAARAAMVELVDQAFVDTTGAGKDTAAA
ncbi:MAG: FadR/GntR family transcriptional regulator [Sphingomicrobium sp.]